MISLDHSHLSNDDTKAEFCREVVENVHASNSLGASHYTVLVGAVTKVSLATLTKKVCANPGSFSAEEGMLMGLIEERNNAMTAVYN